MEEQQGSQSAVLMVPSSVKSLIEALIFAADEPLTPKQIKAIYDNPGVDGEPRSIEDEEIEEIVAELNREFQEAGKAYRIIRIAGGYQFATLPEYAGWLGKLYREQSRRKLSQSSLETLAIIAYKQPITKPEIESIRGVNCDYVLKTLLEKELVTVVGRAETVGRPLLYGTTKEFLKHFGLNDITDLPRPREIEEILGESQFETERRMLEAQAGAERVKKEEEDFKSRLPHIPKKKPGLDEPVEIIPRRRSGELRLTKSRTIEEKPEPTASAATAHPTITPPAEPGITESAQSSIEEMTPVPPLAPAVKMEDSEPPAPIREERTNDAEEETAVVSDSVEPAGPMSPQEDSIKQLAAEDQQREAMTLEGGSRIAEESSIAADARKQESFADDAAAPVVLSDETPLQPESPQDILRVQPPISESEVPTSEHHEPVPRETSPRDGGDVRRTRWQQWKEKIQSIIKKLFA